MVSSVSRAGLDSLGGSTRAVIRRLSDSHPQQSSLRGKPVVYILRDTGIPSAFVLRRLLLQIVYLFYAVGMMWEFNVIS